MVALFLMFLVACGLLAAFLFGYERGLNDGLEIQTRSTSAEEYWNHNEATVREKLHARR